LQIREVKLAEKSLPLRALTKMTLRIAGFLCCSQTFCWNSL